jgi:hypothetical protein
MEVNQRAWNQFFNYFSPLLLNLLRGLKLKLKKTKLDWTQQQVKLWDEFQTDFG